MYMYVHAVTTLTDVCVLGTIVRAFRYEDACVNPFVKLSRVQSSV